jgi:hypothetical protein
LLRVQADLLRDVRDPADPIDELKRRRDEVIAAAKAEPGGEFLHVNSRIHADGRLSRVS